MRQKLSTIAILWASIGFSMWYVNGALWFNLMMLAIACGVNIHLLWLKTYRPEIEETCSDRKTPVLEDIS